MSNNKNILKIAKSVILIEKEAISQLDSQLTNDFPDAVNLIYNSKF